MSLLETVNPFLLSNTICETKSEGRLANTIGINFMKEQNNNKKLSGSNQMKYVLPIFYLDFSQKI